MPAKSRWRLCTIMYGQFPSLFPLGQGLGDGKYLTHDTLRRLLCHYTSAFAQDLPFVATVAGAIVRETSRRER
jgi:hypothetical protein